jgi:hypothetical protein
MKTLKLPTSSGYLLCLLTTALLLVMTPLVASAATVNVNAGVDGFTPQAITINLGDSVLWTATNVSDGGHTVNGDPTGCANGEPCNSESVCQQTLNSGFVALSTVGGTYGPITFTIPGLCAYVSEVHYVEGGYIGTIMVLPSSPSTTTTTTSTTTTTMTTTITTTTTTTTSTTTTTRPTTTTTTTTTVTATTTTSTTAPTTPRTSTTTSTTVTTEVLPIGYACITPGALAAYESANNVTCPFIAAGDSCGPIGSEVAWDQALCTPNQPGTTITTLPGQTTTTITPTTTTTTTVAATTTTTVAATTTTRPTTTTSTTTTTVIRLPDVGILSVQAPDGIATGETRKVEVVIRNFSRTPQTRSLSLTLNGVPVSGSPVSVTVTRNDTVTFNVLFEKPGIATLRARLSPGDVNRANDTETEIKIINPRP